MKIFNELLEVFERKLQDEIWGLEKREPASLYEPVIYCLNMGGKRIRPILLLLAYKMFKDDVDKALPAAVSIEVFHNFTLLHDDIMDKSVLRRNKKTVHIQYSENAAILSGDAMSILATEFLLKCRASNIREVLELFTLTSLEVCEGQQYDIDFERAVKVTLESYINMIRLKTAVLIAGSLKMGALLAGASDNEANSLYNFGLNLGIAFQLRDDYLDTFGDTLKFGKKIGGDIVSNKKTFLLISAIEEAKGENLRTLEYWLGVKEFDRDEKIHNVKGVFDDLGIKEMTMKKIEEYFRKSKDCLKDIKTDPNILNELSEIADLLLEREK